MRRWKPDQEEVRKRSKSKLTLQPPAYEDPTDAYEKSNASKSKIKGQTGLVYDQRFGRHECPWGMDYPEKPERYYSIMQRLSDYELLNRCTNIPCREIELHQVITLHSPEHIRLLEYLSALHDVDAVEQISSRFDSVYYDRDTYATALLAAGSSLNLVQAIMEGEVENGMAIVRPPGHLALQNESSGFCHLNNVALSAQFALNKYNLKRILIVDLAVFHGRSTQRVFYRDPRVLYFSIHRYEYGLFWPYCREADFDHIGAEAGTGFNVNVPLNETSCDDGDYKFILHHLLLPLAYEFKPELVLVSAGFDAAVGCPEGRMRVSPAGYSYIINALKVFSQNKVAVFLEGGNFLSSLSECAALTLGALLGDLPAASIATRPPKYTVKLSVLDSICILRKYWKTLSYHDTLPHEAMADVATTHRPEFLFLEPEPRGAPFPTREYKFCNSHAQNKKHSRWMRRHKIGRDLYLLSMEPKIGYCYDEAMLLHQSPIANIYETPERLTVTMAILKEFGLLERMVKIEAAPATDEQILKYHTPVYLRKLKDLTNQSEADLRFLHNWKDTFSCDATMISARQAAGCVLQLIESVLSNDISGGVAIVRPPGHHAKKDEAAGFCFLNHVVLGARYALSTGSGVRVMILDWDVHHGTGTQRAFYTNPNVLYLSLHRYEKTAFYPNTEEANFYMKGENRGLGFTVNVAWNNNKMTDAEYLPALFRVILPVAQQFQPKLILVSAGFDAAIGDPLGGYSVTPEAFGHFTSLLKSCCGGKIILILEGGHNSKSVGYGMAMCCKALLGDPLPQLNSLGRANDGALQAMANSIRVHGDKWRFLLPQRYALVANEMDPELHEDAVNLINHIKLNRLLSILCNEMGSMYVPW